MDITATLTPVEIAALGDPDRSCGDATRWMRSAAAVSTAQQHGSNDGQSFEESLRLKNTLDVFEEKGIVPFAICEIRDRRAATDIFCAARAEPSWQHLSVLLNCEYQLYFLNQNTPLRYNPFLSHWVEAIQRLAKTSFQSEPSSTEPAHTDEPPSSSGINTARDGLIKSLLRSGDALQSAHLSPRLLYNDSVTLQKTVPFDIGPYIRMLEEEGIYERSSSEKEEVSAQDQHLEESKGAAASQPKLNNRQQWKQNILAQLEDDPSVAIPELTHLPIELSYLDFLTTLLQDRTLQRFSIEPSPIIRDYLQHALRLAEQMGRPPAPTAAGPSEISDGVNGGPSEVVDGVDHGRAAQVRAVKLLLLFIRSLIRKALLPPEAIYFEIQEICVRYVWIKEVREFRAFIEEGAASEQVAA